MAGPKDTTDAADDAAVMSRLAEGDQRALAELYDRYSSLLLGLGVRVLGDRAEAEDVLHDVFVEIWKRAGDFDAARGSVKTWIAMRMRSRCLDRQKSPRVARRVPFEDSAAERQAAPAQNPMLRMERQAVRDAMATLPVEQREVIELAYFKGLSTLEIGAAMGIAQGTVKSRLFSARDKLQRALRGGEAGPGGPDEQ